MMSCDVLLQAIDKIVYTLLTKLLLSYVCMYIIEFIVIGKEYKPTFEDEAENDGQQMVMMLIHLFMYATYLPICIHVYIQVICT